MWAFRAPLMKYEMKKYIKKTYVKIVVQIYDLPDCNLEIENGFTKGT